MSEQHKPEEGGYARDEPHSGFPSLVRQIVERCGYIASSTRTLAPLLVYGVVYAGC